MRKEFKDINRFHKVPVIHDNEGFKLSETVAIYHYLTRKNIIPSSNDSKKEEKIARNNELQISILKASLKVKFLNKKLN